MSPWLRAYMRMHTHTQHVQVGAAKKARAAKQIVGFHRAATVTALC